MRILPMLIGAAVSGVLCAALAHHLYVPYIEAARVACREGG